MNVTKTLAAAAVVMTLGAASIAPASAATVNFLNCKDKKQTFHVFNGGDIFCVVPRHIVTVAANGGTKSRQCNDKKQGCKIRRASDGGIGSCMGFAYAKDGQTILNKDYLGLAAWSGNPTC